ncbi:hypothetical protein ISR94_02695 [Candidatus Microgenomates bacterium]|nr:hypothetical protein [Candidatus Microgenomates bacterium]
MATPEDNVTPDDGSMTDEQLIPYTGPYLGISPLKGYMEGHKRKAKEEGIDLTDRQALGRFINEIVEYQRR